MYVCSKCGTKNDDLEIICTGCNHFHTLYELFDKGVNIALVYNTILNILMRDSDIIIGDYSHLLGDQLVINMITSFSSNKNKLIEMLKEYARVTDQPYDDIVRATKNKAVIHQLIDEYPTQLINKFKCSYCNGNMYQREGDTYVMCVKCYSALDPNTQNKIPNILHDLKYKAYVKPDEIKELEVIFSIYGIKYPIIKHFDFKCHLNISIEVISDYMFEIELHNTTINTNIKKFNLRNCYGVTICRC